MELLVTSDGSIGLFRAARFLPPEGLLVCVCVSVCLSVYVRVL